MSYRRALLDALRLLGWLFGFGGVLLCVLAPLIVAVTIAPENAWVVSAGFLGMLCMGVLLFCFWNEWERARSARRNR